MRTAKIKKHFHYLFVGGVYDSQFSDKDIEQKVAPILFCEDLKPYYSRHFPLPYINWVHKQRHVSVSLSQVIDGGSDWNAKFDVGRYLAAIFTNGHCIMYQEIERNEMPVLTKIEVLISDTHLSADLTKLEWNSDDMNLTVSVVNRFGITLRNYSVPAFRKFVPKASFKTDHGFVNELNDFINQVFSVARNSANYLHADENGYQQFLSNITA